MEDTLTREGALALLIVSLLMLLLGCCSFWWSSPHKHQGPMVAPSPPPTHMEMIPHDVGGFHLLSPVLDDSTHRHMEYPLPMGSILLIPHEVEDRGDSPPDSIRMKT